MKLSASTRRAIRTGYQALIAAAIVIPIVLEASPDISMTGFALALSAAIASISKLINALEDAGFIPAWLK